MDLQLCTKCIKLQDNESIQSQFAFRLGEIHILFATLKIIGKNINFSGVDEAFIEADIYGSTTLQQISGGNIIREVLKHFLLFNCLYVNFISKNCSKVKLY